MAIWVNSDEIIERLKWDFDEEYAKSIVGDATSFRADMVEVVRCKDCKHYVLHALACRHENFNGFIPMNGYCYFGERK